MCLTLIFATINPTLDVHAVALIDDALFFAIASACVWLGVTIATDSEGQQAVADFFYSCTDSVQEFFQAAADNWIEGYNIIYDWQVERWKECADAIADYFGNYTTSYGFINATGDVLGFTDDSIFSFYVNDGIEQETYKISSDSYITTYSNLPVTAIFPNSNVQQVFPSINLSGLSITASDSFSAYCLYNPFCAEIFSNTYTSFSLDALFNGSLRKTASFSFVTASGSSGSISFYPYTVCNEVGHNRFFTDGNTVYQISNIGDVWGFVDSDGNMYNNYQSDTCYGVYFNFFVSGCGLKLQESDSVDVYNPSAWEAIGFTVNKDVLNGKIDELADMPADSTFQQVIPGSIEKLEEVQSNPELVTDLTASDVYTSGIPAVESSPALFQTKFPFCLPFDLYNLFTGMTVNAEAPVFNVIVLPANSFGFQNEEIVWTIDFSQFDDFVKIIRFFEAAAFVVFLIMISRKLIGGE